MGVRVDGQDIGIERELEIVGDGEIAGSGGDVEVLVVFELDQDREFGLGLVGEL
jgi:hypothetical protein